MWVQKAKQGASRQRVRRRNTNGNARSRPLVAFLTMLQQQLRAGPAAACLRGALGSLRTAVSWSHVPEAPKDPILGVSERFLACTNPDKMNLGGE